MAKDWQKEVGDALTNLEKSRAKDDEKYGLTHGALISGRTLANIHQGIVDPESPETRQAARKLEEVRASAYKSDRDDYIAHARAVAQECYEAIPKMIKDLTELAALAEHLFPALNELEQQRDGIAAVHGGRSAPVIARPWQGLAPGPYREAAEAAKQALVEIRNALKEV